MMMTYLNSWHRDYAAESIKRFEEKNGNSEEASKLWINFAVECGQVVKLVNKSDDSKARSIAQTVIEIINASNKLGKRSYKKITPRQRYALTVELINRFGTARAIAHAVWGLSDEEINNADI